MSLLRAAGLRRHFSIPAAASEIEPNRSVEECAGLLTWVAAGAAAVATFASGVGGGDTGTYANNLAIENVPDVISVGRNIGAAYSKSDRTYAENVQFIQKYDQDGDMQLSLSEFNDALADEGFDIKVSKKVFEMYDSGTKMLDNPNFGVGVEAAQIHNGKLNADELSDIKTAGYSPDRGNFMQLEEALVVKVDKVTGVHTLDIRDGYNWVAKELHDDLEEHKKAKTQADDGYSFSMETVAGIGAGIVADEVLKRRKKHKESAQNGEDDDSKKQDRRKNMFGAIKRVDLSKDSDKQFLQWSSNLTF